MMLLCRRTRMGLLFRFFMVGIFCYGLGVTQTRADLSEGLVAYWAFEGGGSQELDLSGNSHNGTLEDATRATGKIGQAMTLLGQSTDEQLDAGTFDIDNDGTAVQAMTITAWVKADSFLAGSADNRIISKANSTDESGHWWMLSTIDVSGTKRIRFRLKTDDGGTKTLIGGNTAITTDTWYHVAATYDGQYMKIYIDGVLDQSTTKQGDVERSASVSVYVGNQPGGAKNWDGLIDEVRVYNRCLNAGEVGVLADELNIVDQPGLIGYWPLNETSGTTVIDYAGGAFNGTVTGATVNQTGKIDKAVDFDDSGDVISMGLGFHESPTDELTLSAMIYVDNLPTSSEVDRIVAKVGGNGSSDECWALDVVESSGSAYLRFNIHNGTTHTLLTDTTALSADTWYHVVARYDGSVMQIFIDGVFAASTAKTGDINSDNTAQLVIGGNPSGYGDYAFDGLIDEVRVYDRALTTADIANLGSLVLQWNMDELADSGSNVVTPDSSPYGNDGTSSSTDTGATPPTLAPELVVGKHRGLKFVDETTESDHLTSDSAPIDPSTDDFTVMTWVKLTKGSLAQTLVGQDGSYVFLGITSTQQLFFYIGGQYQATTTTLDLNEWYHVAVTKDDSNIKLYIDNVQELSISTPSISSSTGSLLVGYGVEGQLDDVRVYNAALTGGQIQSIVGFYSEAAEEVTALEELLGSSKTVDLTGSSQTISSSNAITAADLKDIMFADPPQMKADIPSYSSLVTSTTGSFYYGYTSDGYNTTTHTGAPYVADDIQPFRFKYFNNMFHHMGTEAWNMQDYAVLHGFDIISGQYKTTKTSNRITFAANVTLDDLVEHYPDDTAISYQISTNIVGPYTNNWMDNHGFDDKHLQQMSDDYTYGGYSGAQAIAQQMIDAKDRDLNDVSDWDGHFDVPTDFAGSDRKLITYVDIEYTPHQYEIWHETASTDLGTGLRDQTWYGQDYDEFDGDCDGCPATTPDTTFEEAYEEGYANSYIGALRATRNSSWDEVSIWGGHPISNMWHKWRRHPDFKDVNLNASTSSIDYTDNHYDWWYKWRWETFIKPIYQNDKVDDLFVSTYLSSAFDQTGNNYDSSDTVSVYKYTRRRVQNVAHSLGMIDLTKMLEEDLDRDVPIHPWYWGRYGNNGYGYQKAWWEYQAVEGETMRALAAMNFFTGVDGFYFWNNYHNAPDPEDAVDQIDPDVNDIIGGNDGIYRFQIGTDDFSPTFESSTNHYVGGNVPDEVTFERYDVIELVDYTTDAGGTTYYFQKATKSYSTESGKEHEYGVDHEFEDWDTCRASYSALTCSGTKDIVPWGLEINSNEYTYPLYSASESELESNMRPMAETTASVIEGLAMAKALEFCLAHGEVKHDWQSNSYSEDDSDYNVPAQLSYARFLPIVRRVKIGEYHIVATYEPDWENLTTARNIVIPNFDGDTGRTLTLPTDPDGEVLLFILKD